jgi:hypothetical protein
VIGSQAGGIADRIVDGVNGRTFTPGSSAQLAQIMQDCTGNRRLWDRLSNGIADEVDVDAAWAGHKDIISGLA